MKKLGKLNINPEKVIKNEELISLKGGYDGGVTIFCKRDEQHGGNCEVYWLWCGDEAMTNYLCEWYCPNYFGAVCAG
jgi:hypothetical protein